MRFAGKVARDAYTIRGVLESAQAEDARRTRLSADVRPDGAVPRRADAHGLPPRSRRGRLPIDANLEAFDALLEPAPLSARRRARRTRDLELEALESLRHEEQLALRGPPAARADARASRAASSRQRPSSATMSVSSTSDAYDSATRTIDAALRAVSAAHHPLHLDFTAYRTPFGLLSQDEIQRMSSAAYDPFDDYVETALVPRLRASGANLVGLSVCFPGQLQPAYAFAWKIKRALPHVHLTAGGPGLTQMMIRLRGSQLAHALGPFDSGVVFEGEQDAPRFSRAVADGRPLRDIPNLVVRDRPPGCPLARRATSGGPADAVGARLRRAPPRELPRAAPGPSVRPDPRLLLGQVHVLPLRPRRGRDGVVSGARRRGDVVDHLVSCPRGTARKHFYFSQDSVAPKTLLKLATGSSPSGLDVSLGHGPQAREIPDGGARRDLRRAGAVACALGVESGSERVLRAHRQGGARPVVSDVIARLASAGIAAEAMCFTDFPTETHAEALETLDFWRRRSGEIARLYRGRVRPHARVARGAGPGALRYSRDLGLDGRPASASRFSSSPRTRGRTDDQRADVEPELDRTIARAGLLRSYPWAGAVSTAHTVLYYDRFGPDVFKRLARRTGVARVFGAARLEGLLHFDPAAAARAEDRDGSVWATMVADERRNQPSGLRGARVAPPRTFASAVAVRVRRRSRAVARQGTPPAARGERRHPEVTFTGSGRNGTPRCRRGCSGGNRGGASGSVR